MPASVVLRVPPLGAVWLASSASTTLGG
jgi:hypothetical protein